MNFKDIDVWRKGHMAIAEWIDGWRLIPRLLVAAYAYLMWKVVKWYMHLQPEMIEGCNVELLKEACIVMAPTTQHAALVTAVVGISAAVFGLYSSSGRKWNGFTYWNKKSNDSASEQNSQPGQQSS